MSDTFLHMSEHLESLVNNLEFCQTLDLNVDLTHHHGSFEQRASGMEIYKAVQQKNELIRCLLLHFQRTATLEESILGNDFRRIEQGKRKG